MGRPGAKRQRLKYDHAGPLTAIAFDRDAARDPESLYTASTPISHRRRFGQFFTPPQIADLMTAWIRGANPKSILDPAVGTGVFPRAIRDCLPEARVVALDIDPYVLDFCRRSAAGANASFEQADFLTWHDQRQFDAVIANPPYLRHHDIQYAEDIHAKVGRLNGRRLSRLTNIYGLFILEICRRTRSGGRAAIIVPGEWANANFGREIKEHLLESRILRHLVYFSHASSLFENALTTASILLVENSAGGDTLTTTFVAPGAPVPKLSDIESGPSGNESPGLVRRELPIARLASEPKWDHVLAQGFKEAHPGLVPLKALAQTRRGIATGANDFFHLAKSRCEALGLPPASLLPCIGRAVDVKGLVFESRDFEALAAGDRRAFLFAPRQPLGAAERKYVDLGAEQGLSERYLTKARKLWYAPERREPAPVWAAVFGRKTLRFIRNRSGISNLTTFHCIYPASRDPRIASALVACLNSGFVQERAKSQRRVYGGGLLKFEPRDLLEIEVPDLRRAEAGTIAALAELLDALDAAFRKRGRMPKALGARLDRLVVRAAAEASRNPGLQPSRKRPYQERLALPRG